MARFGFRRRRGNGESDGNGDGNTTPLLPTRPAPAGRSLTQSLTRPRPRPLSRGRNRSDNRSDSVPRARPVSDDRPTLICHTCREPISRQERHIHTSRALSGERRYHRRCFLCLHCGAPIDPQTQSFCYAKLTPPDRIRDDRNDNFELRPGDDEHPFHRDCFARHFGWICVVCEKPLPMVTKFNNPGDGNDQPGGKSTKVEFLKHPFFDKERMCPHHVGPLTEQIQRHVQQTNRNNQDGPNGFPFSSNGRTSVNTTTSEEVIGEIRRCAGCHRFEPLFADPSKHFIDVGDGDTGRCVCLACCRTVVTTSDDVIPLWDKVIDFFEGPLGLITSEESLMLSDPNYLGHGGPCGRSRKGGVTRQDLKAIPIVVVGMEALNDNLRSTADGRAHLGSGQVMTRGLCLSEHCPDDRSKVGVTAILCLSGLPADLTASILAHEATHAWIKLHPNFPAADPLPLRVEEGLCQLVAHLFLNDGLDPVEDRESALPAASAGGDFAWQAAAGDLLLGEAARTTTREEDDAGPSDEKLRQYFRFCIETDDGVYGEGFRLAARAYAAMGMQELLYYVAVNHDFPPL